MSAMHETLEALSSLMSLPAVRLFALGVSSASFLVSLGRKTNLAVRTFRGNVLAAPIPSCIWRDTFRAANSDTVRGQHDR
jgi:hypothetical protein